MNNDTPRFYVPAMLQSAPWHIHHGIPCGKLTWVGWTLNREHADIACDLLNEEAEGSCEVYLREDFKEYPKSVEMTILKKEACQMNLVTLCKT